MVASQGREFGRKARGAPSYRSVQDKHTAWLAGSLRRRMENLASEADGLGDLLGVLIFVCVAIGQAVGNARDTLARPIKSKGNVFAHIAFYESAD